MVAEKGVPVPKHPAGTQNASDHHVVKAMQPLKPRGCDGTVCLETFTDLTNEGSPNLHDYLHLPPTPHPEIMPATLAAAGLSQAGQGPEVWRVNDLQESQEGMLTDTYRQSAAPCTHKKAEAGAVSATEFQFIDGLIWSWTWSTTSFKLGGILLC